MSDVDPVLDAIVAGALDATASDAAWILVATDTGLRVAAGIGVANPDAPPIGHGDLVGMVINAGQPVAVHGLAATGGPSSSAVEHVLGRVPANLLGVPCATSEGVHGALIVADRSEGAYSVDDIEIVTLLAEIAGPALADRARRAPSAPSALEMSAWFVDLERSDPRRYAVVASVVQRLLAE